MRPLQKADPDLGVGIADTSSRQKPVGSSARKPVVRISAEVLAAIDETIAAHPPERGGILGADRSSGIIGHFYLDTAARTSGAAYSPDIQSVNALLKGRWNPRGIRLKGIVHSHPGGFARPSDCDDCDTGYAARILAGIPDLELLFLPIVARDPDGVVRLHPFVALRAEGHGVKIRRARVVVEPAGAHRGTMPASSEARLARVAAAYDLPLLSRARVVYVGVGGAAFFAQDMARTGVRDHVAVDGDVVEAVNVATQEAVVRDVGVPKVARLVRQIGEIDPSASVLAVPQWLEDVDDAAFERLLYAPLEPPCCNWIPRELGGRPSVTLLCGFTDSFPAQARVNRLALQFGVPSLCAQMYREGRGAEITFTYPGLTPACHRCVLSTRYAAYLDDGFRNDVTSAGAPIFATTRLNALCGFIAMALFHHGSAHPRWGRLLERIGDRNLLQVRMDPDLELRAFARAFAQADAQRVLFDETVWLRQRPDGPADGRPACPDCAGTGDLRRVIGSITDTRVMRPNAAVAKAPLMPQPRGRSRLGTLLRLRLPRSRPPSKAARG